MANHNDIKRRGLIAAAIVFLLASLAGYIAFSESRVLLFVISAVFFALSFRSLKLGIVLLAFITPLLPRLPEKFGTANFSIAELLLLVLLISWLLSLLLDEKIRLRKTKLDVWIFLIIGFMVISFFTALARAGLFSNELNSSSGVLYPLKVLIDSTAAVMLYFVIVNAADKQLIKKVVGALAASLLVTSGIGIYFYFSSGFEKVRAEEGALHIELPENNDFRNAYALHSVQFAVDSSRQFSLSGIVRAEKLSGNTSVIITAIGYNATGRAQWQASRQARPLANWTTMRNRFSFREDINKADITILLYNANATPAGHVILDRIILNEGNRTVFLDGFYSIGNWLPVQHFIRAASTLEHPNIFGEYLVLVLPLAAAAIFGSGALFGIIALLLSLPALLLTFSRGAYFGIVAAALLLFKKNRRNMAILAVIIAAIMLAAAIRHPLTEPFISRALSVDDAPQDSRVELTKEALKMAWQEPLLGAGLGTFRVAHGLRFDYHHAHNLYLQIAAERGIPALLAFVAMLIVFYFEALKAELNDKYLSLVNRALLMGITALLIHGLFDYVFYSQRIAMLFWMAVGLVAGMGRMR